MNRASSVLHNTKDVAVCCWAPTNQRRIDLSRVTVIWRRRGCSMMYNDNQLTQVRILSGAPALKDNLRCLAFPRRGAGPGCALALCNGHTDCMGIPCSKELEAS